MSVPQRRERTYNASAGISVEKAIAAYSGEQAYPAKHVPFKYMLSSIL